MPLTSIGQKYQDAHNTNSLPVKSFNFQLFFIFNMRLPHKQMRGNNSLHQQLLKD